MNDDDHQLIPGGGRPADGGRGREGSSLGGLWLLLVPLACCGGLLLIAALAAAGALAWGGIGRAAAVLLARPVLAIRRRRRACRAPAEWPAHAPGRRPAGGRAPDEAARHAGDGRAADRRRGAAMTVPQIRSWQPGPGEPGGPRGRVSSFRCQDQHEEAQAQPRQVGAAGVALLAELGMPGGQPGEQIDQVPEHHRAQPGPGAHQ